MFVLNKENTQKFTRERKELEALDITPEEYERIKKEASNKIFQAYDIFDYDLRGICERNPFLANVIGPIIAMGLNNLDYAYGLITGISSPEDDPEVYQKDREDILKNLRVEILGKKPLKESEEK